MIYDISCSGSGDPVTLVEAKAHLRVLHTSEDALIPRFISAASRFVENRIGRSLVNRTWTLKRDGFPKTYLSLGTSAERRRMLTSVPLPNPPVSAVTSVTYLDETGTLQTLDPGAYQLVKSPVDCELVPAPGTLWPQTSNARRCVTIVYTSGYGRDETTVPQDIRNAVLLMVQHFYDHRSAVADSARGSVIESPLAVDALLAPYMTTGWI